MKIFMQLKLNFLLPDLSNDQLYMPTNDVSQRTRGRNIGPLKDVSRRDRVKENSCSHHHFL